MKRWTPLAGAAVVGIVLLAIGLAIDPARTQRSWHWVWLWASGVSLGALMLLLVSHLAPIGWLAGLRRPLAGLACAQVVLAPGLVVLPAGGFVQLAVVAVAVVVGAATWITRGDEAVSVHRLQRLAAVGVPLVAVGWTVLAVQLGMGVGEAWLSHAVGVRWFAQGMLGATAGALLLAIVAERLEVLPRLPEDFVHAHGRLLLGFVLLWAYLVYCELFIPWIVDEPAHVPYLAARVHGPGGVLLRVLWIGGLGLPLVVLLSRRLKEHRPTMAALSGWLIGVSALDALWLVAPTARPELHPAGLGGLLLCGSLLAALGLLAVDGADPLLAATLGYRRKEP